MGYDVMINVCAREKNPHAPRFVKIMIDNHEISKSTTKTRFKTIVDLLHGFVPIYKPNIENISHIKQYCEIRNSNNA